MITPNDEPDAAIYRVFEALDELQATVETARGLPMSLSCVLPRGLLLDLIDDIRQALPAELDDAQVVLGNRDDLLARAQDELNNATAQTQAERERTVKAARAQAEETVRVAREEADRTVRAGRAEAERLVSAGQSERERLVAETEVMESARRQAEEIVAEAKAESARMKAEADHYVEEKLAAFAELLGRTLRSVEKGRDALRERGTTSAPWPRVAAQSDGDESPSAFVASSVSPDSTRRHADPPRRKTASRTGRGTAKSN